MSRRSFVWTALGTAISVVVLIIAALILSPPPKELAASQVSITGLVDNKITMSLDQLKSMPIATITAELICVDGQSLGVHNWTGVRLKDILNYAGVQPTAIKVGFYASGYSTDLTIADAMRDDVLVAYLEDGVPMSSVTRLVVPGEWGYKWISGLESIKLVDYNFLGKWESRGYPDDATISST